MEIVEIKAWAFDKQMQLETLQQHTDQLNSALLKISEMVGLPPGGVPLQTLIDAVGASLAEKNGANAQEQ